MNFVSRFLFTSICIFFILETIPLFGSTQIKSIIDSININRTITGDSSRIRLMLDIGELYEAETPDSGLAYYEKALALCETALENQPHNSAEKLVLDDLKATSLRYIGNVYNDLGVFDKAVENYLHSLQLHQATGNLMGIAYCYNNIGNIHADQGDFEKATDYYTSAINIYKQLDDKTGLAAANNNIGSILFDQQKYEEAISYFLETLKAVGDMNHKKGMANTFNNLGETYSKMGQYKTAIEYYKKTLEVSSELGDKFGLAMANANIADLYVTLAESAAEPVRSERIMLALVSGKASMELAKEINSPRLINYASNILKKVHKTNANYSEALKYAELYIETNEEIFSEDKTNALAEMQEKYQSLEKEKTIEKLEFENEIADNEIKRRKNQILFSILGLILISISLLLVYSRYRLKHSLNKALELKNNELAVLNATKDKFVSILAHDLKNPFSAFANITSSLNTNFEKIDKDEQKYFIEELDRSAFHMKKLLKNMLDWASAQMKPKFQTLENIELSTLVSNMCQTLDGFAKTRKITLVNRVSQGIKVKANEGALNTVLNNLMTNAIKFSPLGNRVEIRAQINQSRVDITVTDYGIGIAPQDIGKLFRIDVDVRSIGTPEGKGTGLGLILCKELAEKMNGQLYAESTFGKETTMHLMLWI